MATVSLRKYLAEQWSAGAPAATCTGNGTIHSVKLALEKIHFQKNQDSQACVCFQINYKDFLTLYPLLLLS